jgi:TatD DNase family protein
VVKFCLRSCDSALKFVDAHVHLCDSEYKDRVGEIVAIAKKTGVVAMVTNSTDLETSKLSLELAGKHRGLVYAAVGIHPWNANQLALSELQKTVDFICGNVTFREKIVAVGEIGLDPQYAKRKEQKELQVKVFNEMVRLAERLVLPVIVHSRWSAQKIMDILPSYRLKGVLWHWFSGPSELLTKIVERGDYVSEGPPVAYSEKIQEIVRYVPLERLLTETDGPVRYYGPFMDKPTTPALILQTVKAISQVKKSEEPHVAEQILRNFAHFFDIQLRDSTAPSNAALCTPR